MTSHPLHRLLLVALLVAGGCGPEVPARTAPTGAAATTAIPQGTTTSTPAASPAVGTVAPLLAISLIDVRSGATFSLAQFGGKVTVVQHMAVW